MDNILSLASQTMCYHIFSDLESDHNFHIFGYVLGLYFVSSRICQLYTLFEDRNVMESTVSWFLIEYNLIQKEDYFPPNAEPN